MKRMLGFFGKSSTSDADEPPDRLEIYKSKGNKSGVVNYHVQEVTDFSSQYGSETSISYSACNLSGRGSIYPHYGDFTQACVFRTYGPWWDMMPSSRKPFTRTPPWFCSQDYIEISFQAKVYPWKLEIYETYNPGSVVRILACEGDNGTDVDSGLQLNRWKTLWEGKPTMTERISRCFCPPLKLCPFPTDRLRLELCHQYVHYYTELDCVVLHGVPVANYNKNVEGIVADDLTPIVPPINTEDEKSFNSVLVQLQKWVFSFTEEKVCKLNRQLARERGLKRYKTKSNDERNVTGSDHISHCDGCTSEQTNNGDNKVPGVCGLETIARQTSEEDKETDNGYFDRLPEEVIQLILSFLDMFSLCRVARTCRLFHKHSYDSLQYTELNLQPHWAQVTNLALDSLHSRCQHLQRLNLSWCHRNIVTHKGFSRFVEACGHSLFHLYLSSCSFLQSESIEDIARHCPNLTELDLGSCRQIESRGLFHLHRLVHLQSLNLYRTAVNNDTLLTIIRELVSIDLWRCKNVTDVGIKALAANCPLLEELDLGWCPDLKSSSKFVIDIAEKCPKLKKLFLTANRSICDNDILALAKYSSNLEQLDILGTRQVSVDAAMAVLENCQKLVYFDVSFCSGIENYTVNAWTRDYPKVSIKKSFQ